MPRAAKSRCKEKLADIATLETNADRATSNMEKPSGNNEEENKGPKDTGDIPIVSVEQPDLHDVQSKPKRRRRRSKSEEKGIQPKLEPKDEFDIEAESYNWTSMKNKSFTDTNEKQGTLKDMYMTPTKMERDALYHNPPPVLDNQTKFMYDDKDTQIAIGPQDGETEESTKLKVTLYCYKCDLAFSSEPHFDNHMMHKHRGDYNAELDFQCTPKYKHALDVVKDTKDKYAAKKLTNKFKCSKCGKLMFSKQTLQTHMKIHLDRKPLSCETCGFTFNDRATLRRHRLTHTDARPFVCMICQKTFKQNGNLTSHMTVHSNERRHACELCPKRFNQKTHLMKHMRCVHENKREFKCEVCSKAFNEASHLKVHFRQHTNEKPYSCDICPDKRFSDISNYNLHMRYHEKIKPYACMHCDMKFSQTSDLKRHTASRHSSLRPFKCKLCEYATALENNMRKHVLSHLKLKPHKCQFCGKGFESNYSKVRHEKTQHELTFSI